MWRALSSQSPWTRSPSWSANAASGRTDFADASRISRQMSCHILALRSNSLSRAGCLYPFSCQYFSALAWNRSFGDAS